MSKIPRYITQIVLPYAIFTALWVFFSDRYLATLDLEVSSTSMLHTYKTWILIALSSILLSILLRHEKNQRERIRNEQIRARERIFGILESISDGFVALDKDWNYQYINQRAGEFLGRDPTDLIGKNVWKEFPEALNQDIYHAYQRAMHSQQPEIIEKFYPPWQRWFENRIHPSPEGLHIFFQDITTRKQAELWREGQGQVLEKIVTEHPLTEILETLIRAIESQATSALGSVMLLDSDGQHLHYETGPSLPAGLAPAIEGMPIGPTAGACGTAAYTRELVIIEDFQTDPRGVDYRALTAQLNLRACWSQPVFSASGEVLGTFAIYYTEARSPSDRELTLINEAGHLASVAIEAARNRSALKATEMRFRATFEQAAVGIAHVSPEGKFLRINQRFCDIAGYPLSELLTLTFQDITHPDDLDADLHQLQRVLVGTIDTYSMEKRYRRKDGEFIWINLTVSLVHKDDATADYFIAVVEDISVRKQTEAALQQRDERFQIVARATNDAVWDWDLVLHDLWWNENFYTLFGYAATDIEPGPESWVTRIHPDDVTRVTHGIHAVINGQDQYWTDEYRFRRHDGQYAEIFDRGFVIRDAQGKGIRMIGAMQDISQRKHAEVALRASEEHLRLALDAAHMGGFDWDIPNNHIAWSYWHEALWGFKPGEFPGTYEAFAQRVHSDDLPGIHAEIKCCIAEQKPFAHEFRVVWPDGSTHWILSQGEFTLNAQNQALRMRGTVIDITARKQTEAALRQSEEHFRTIFEQAMDGILISDEKTKFLDVNSAICQMLGYSREDLLKMDVSKIVVAEDLPKLEPALANLRLKGQVRSEWRLRRQDGSVIFAEVSSKTLTDGRLQGFVRDISEYRKAQIALQEREEILRLFVEHSPAAIGMFDTEMRYVVASRRWLTDYHLSDQNIIGRSHYDVLPEISPAWRAIHQRCLAGETASCDEDSFVRADGHTDWLKWEICPWRKADNRIGGIVIFSELVTDRRLAAKKIAEDAKSLARLSRQLLAAQETERRHIARELHDEVGQLLTVVKLDLQTVLRQQQSQVLNTSVREGMESIDRVISRVRDLSLDLRPSMLDDFGLAPALRWLVQRHAKRLETQIDLELPPNPPRLSTEVETACFRIVQEALTNILRHAKAKTIRIAVVLNTQTIEVSIKDDGKGFDYQTSQATEKSGAGFGVLGMHERAELAGGEFEMITAPGQGCCVIARFPLTRTVESIGIPE